MLLCTLGEKLLGNVLECNCVIKAGNGIIRSGDVVFGSKQHF